MLKLVIVDTESAQHESTESRYTKMREGEYSGVLPGAFGEAPNTMYGEENLGGGSHSGNMKKAPDPVEAAEGDY